MAKKVCVGVCAHHTREGARRGEEGLGWVSGKTIAIRKLKTHTLKKGNYKAVSVFFTLNSQIVKIHYRTFHFQVQPRCTQDTK